MSAADVWLLGLFVSAVVLFILFVLFVIVLATVGDRFEGNCQATDTNWEESNGQEGDQRG